MLGIVENFYIVEKIFLGPQDFTFVLENWQKEVKHSPGCRVEPRGSRRGRGAEPRWGRALGSLCHLYVNNLYEVNVDQIYIVFIAVFFMNFYCVFFTNFQIFCIWNYLYRQPPVIVRLLWLCRKQIIIFFITQRTHPGPQSWYVWPKIVQTDKTTTWLNDQLKLGENIGLKTVWTFRKCLEQRLLQ